MVEHFPFPGPPVEELFLFGPNMIQKTLDKTTSDAKGDMSMYKVNDT